MSDDFLNNTLTYTDEQRRKFLKKLEENNNGVIPTDTDSANLYLKALKDMDSAAVNHARVKTEEKMADNDAGVAALIRDVVRKLDGRNPFKTDTPVGDKRSPEIPEDIEATVVVSEGAMETGVVGETVDEFNKRRGLED